MGIEELKRIKDYPFCTTEDFSCLFLDLQVDFLVVKFNHVESNC